MRRTWGTIWRTLRLCSRPMKSQVNSSPWAATLREEILRTVLPHELDARLSEQRHVLERDVLGRREHLHRGGVASRAHGSGGDLLTHLREVCGDRLGAQIGDQLSHVEGPGAPGPPKAPPRARWAARR